VGKLVIKPFNNWKKAIESFNEHAGHEFHLAATTRARDFISVFENKKKDIFESLHSGRKAQALQNRAKLNPTVKNCHLLWSPRYSSQGVILTREH
jgi:predicted SpoU family rRNA methylase